LPHGPERVVDPAVRLNICRKLGHHVLELDQVLDDLVAEVARLGARPRQIFGTQVNTANPAVQQRRLPLPGADLLVEWTNSQRGCPARTKLLGRGAMHRFPI